MITQPSFAYLVPILFGLGMGGVSPALTAWMLRTTPANERAFAVNTFTILAEGSGFVGSWVMGWILQIGNQQYFYLLVLILGVGLMVFLKTSREKI
jgi:MFS family permease